MAVMFYIAENNKTKERMLPRSFERGVAPELLLREPTSHLSFGASEVTFRLKPILGTSVYAVKYSVRRVFG